MEKTTKRMVRLGTDDVHYVIKRYKGQKRINMHVRHDGLLVTAPPRVPIVEIEQALLLNKKWIAEHVLAHAKCAHITYDKKVIEHVKAHLLPIIEAKIDFYNYYYQFDFTDIGIRNQKTRWGSCSSSGSLSFNVHLAVLPEKLMDYVIVHELCHLKEMNHSEKFWALVAKCIPDYKVCRKSLKSYSLNG